MATRFFFNNQEIYIPGAYSQVKSGIKNPSLALAFGNTLLIDTSIGAKGGLFGGGAGINGTLATGKDSHYTFDNVRDFRNFVKGGLPWAIAGPLFLPGGGATAGISSLTYIRAKTTSPATIFIPFGAYFGESDSDGDITNDGSLTIQVRDEGYCGNGVLGDETRATCTVTITNAGSASDTITIRIDGEVAATYAVQTGDSIANVVSGLVSSFNDYGFTEVVTSTTSTITFYAPHGYAEELNGDPATISVTGSVAGSSGNFSGGAEGTILTRGYGATVVAGLLDDTKYIVKFWRGSFRGLDDDILLTGTTTAFDGLNETSTKPELVVQSPEVSTVQEIVTWMQDEAGDGFTFNQYFKLSSYSIATGTDEIIDQDLTNNYIKATGGTESYSATDLQAALDSIEDLTFDFILADRWGDNARSSPNISIVDFVTNTAKIKPDVYIAAGATVGEFNSGAATASTTISVAYDSQYVTVVHGGAKVTDVGGRNFKQYDSIWKAATLLGREAGLAPQVPLTFKNIGIQGETHTLTVKEQKIALNSGLLVTKPGDSSGFEVLKGINTLQNNKYLVNPDGSTHSKQLARIVRQINKEITVNAKEVLLKKPNGANRNTVSVEDVKEFVKTFLQDRVSKRDEDNLLISFRNVEVTLSQDAYEIVYGIEANTEISFLFFTAFLLDPNS